MGNIFEMDKTALRKLAKFQKKFPVKFNHAASGVLNAQAFEGRRSIMKELKDEFTIRNRQFLRSAVLVDRAKGNVPIMRQFSIVGSVHRENFTGWIEQQIGSESKKGWVSTEKAREGNFKKQQSPKYRLSSKRGLKTAKDYKSKYVKTKGQQVFAMIKDSKKTGQPFILHQNDVMGRFTRMKPGMWGFDGDNLYRFQTFGEKWKPKRVDWMGGAMRRLERSFNLEKVWDNELSRQLKRR